MATSNKFPGRCNNPACPLHKNVYNGVAVGEGFITKINNRWVTWCRECVPVQKAEGEVERRVLMADGKIFTPYEPANLPLIKSLKGPGGVFGPKWNKDGKFWEVSLSQADRQRLLEVADRLRLEVAPQLREGNVVTEQANNALHAGLYPFQVTGVNWMAKGRKRLLADEMGLGKSQPLTAKILTPTGWTTMGQIQVGQQVIGRDGKPHTVTGIFPQGKLPVFKVSFSDGSSTESSDDHLWAVNSANRNFAGRPYKVLPLSEIRQSLKNTAGNNQHFIPLVAPVEMQSQALPLNPWLIGYLIANGNLTTNTPKVTAPDADAQERVKWSLPSRVQFRPKTDTADEIDFVLSGTDERFAENPLTGTLRSFGLMGKGFSEKFIPPVCLFNDITTRVSLFQGLMDGDGSVTASDNHLEYSTGSEQLAKDVVFLVQSFGGTAKVASRIPTYTDQGVKKQGSVSYRVSIALPKGITPFLLARKADVYKERRKYQPTRAIISVEPSGEAECQCISVDAEDHLYVTDNLVVTHNTIQALVSVPAHGKALVVCPATLKLNWRNEAKVWRPDLTPVVLSGEGSFRFPKAGEIVITNYDILADFLDPTPKQKGQRQAPKITWEALKAWRLKLKEQHPEADGVTVIFDEAHKVKNYKTERSRKVRELSRLSANVWGLTGTPLDNEPSDLYGILDSLDMAFDVFTPRKGQSPFRRFQELFGAESAGRFGGTRYGSPDPMVPELLRRVMLRRKRDEVMPDLPRKTYSNLIVGDMPASIRRQLDEMWESDGTALEVGGSLPPFEQFSKIRAALAKSNIPAMLEYIENAEEQDVPLVVFSEHLAPLDALLGRPGWGVISGATSLEKRQEIVDAFQAGRLKGVALTIRAGGVGLTLTHAWKVLFVDLDWVPGWNSQAEDRVCRIGQTSNKVEVIRMVNDHPLTLHIINTLAEKTALIEKAVENSFTVTVPTGPAKVQKDSETEEEFQARMGRIQAAQEALEKEKAQSDAAQAKAKAKSKVDLIHGREKGRNQRPILPLTDKRVGVVREAFRFMLSVCDGAVEKDGQGFNKPDAVVAHWLLTAGLETPKEVEAAYYMLVRYHRQLSASYPVLFNSQPEDRAAIVAQAQADEQ